MERHTKMAQTEPTSPVFQQGDEVVLVKGTYQGTLGVFVRLRDDVAWAEIAERNGHVRSHPVAWLGHCEERDRSPVSVAGAEREAGIG
jgi:hypothetical protein